MYNLQMIYIYFLKTFSSCLFVLRLVPVIWFGLEVNMAQRLEAVWSLFLTFLSQKDDEEWKRDSTAHVAARSLNMTLVLGNKKVSMQILTFVF